MSFVFRSVIILLYAIIIRLERIVTAQKVML
jgi:hypothetical protein